MHVQGTLYHFELSSITHPSYQFSLDSASMADATTTTAYYTTPHIYPEDFCIC
jgi:hypothetical protein